MSRSQGTQEPPEACRGEEGSPPEPVEGVGSCQHPDFGLPFFRTRREVLVVFATHPAGETSLQSPREADAGDEAATPPGQAQASRPTVPTSSEASEGDGRAEQASPECSQRGNQVARVPGQSSGQFQQSDKFPHHLSSPIEGETCSLTCEQQNTS